MYTDLSVSTEQMYSTANYRRIMMERQNFHIFDLLFKNNSGGHITSKLYISISLAVIQHGL